MDRDDSVRDTVDKAGFLTDIVSTSGCLIHLNLYMMDLSHLTLNRSTHVHILKSVP